MREESRALAVVGLGYIGLPTAVVLAESGWDVTGVDVSDRTVSRVNLGKLPFVEEGLETSLAAMVQSGKLRAVTEMPAARVYIVAVPTPFIGDHEGDLSYIDAATDAIIPQLVGGELIILESTSPVGTTQRMAERVWAARPDLPADEVHFADAPERVLPGRIMIEMRANDRIVGGLTPEATRRAAAIYGSFCAGKIYETDARTAELSKLTENAFRDVNIAFANELSLLCDGFGIDVWELISLANRHPRVNILNPGPGVGGHCIAVDPWFIVSGDPENSVLIRTAREVNDGKPSWVISKIEELAQGQAEVAMLGLAFKPNIDDLRESPAVAIVRRVAQAHPEYSVLVAEPHIDELPPALSALPNVTLVDAADAVRRASVVVALVAHDAFAEVGSAVPEATAVIDTVGMWR